MHQAFLLALEQAESILSSIDWRAYDDILFIGKSVGTVVAGAYAEKYQISARLVLLTPVMETFNFIRGSAIAFHGTADPWARTEDVIRKCEGTIPLYLTEEANHSLETGNVEKDIGTLLETMRTIKEYITAG